MKWLALVVSFFLIPPCFAAADETSRDIGAHILYFNVFNSSFLTPEIAAQNNLTRSRYKAILNLAVHKKNEAGNEPIEVLLKGTVTNIVQQQRSLTFKTIVEGDAIYYLSEFRITDDDLLTFDINIRANPDSEGYNLQFKRRVYVDN